MKRKLNNLIYGCSFCLLFVFSCFGQIPVSNVGNTEKIVTPLEIGQTIEREISVGNKHFYKIKLEAGQFARIEAEQQSCDVVFSMLTPEGFNLLEFKNVAESGGIETVNVAVEAGGEYEFRVSAFHGEEKSGTYKLKIAEIRSATVQEISFSTGMRLTDEGFKLTRDNATTDDLKRGMEKFSQAVEKFRIADAAKREGVVLRNIGAVYDRLGNRRKSIEYANLAMERIRAAKWNYGEFKVLQDLGKTYFDSGEPEKSLEFLFKAAAFFPELNNLSEEADTLNAIGKVFERVGDWQRAVTYFEQAITAAKKDEEPNVEADADDNLGRIYFSLGNNEKAQAYFLKALELTRAGKTKAREARILNNLAKIYQTLGDTEKAFENFNEALKIYGGLGNKIGEAATRKNLGQLYLTIGEFDKSLASLNQSAEIYRTIEDEQNLAETLLVSAKTEIKKGNADAAQAKTEEAIKLIEKIRARVQSVELRDSFSANLQSYYSFYIELLMERHKLSPDKNFAARAFEANERARARGLLNLLTESNADIRHGVDEKLLEKETDLKNLLSARLENLTKVLSGKTDESQTLKLKNEIERIRAEYEQIQAQIRATSPRYAALTQPKTLSLAEIQSEVLDADSVLLEYSLGETKSFMWIVTKNSLQAVELPEREKIEATAKQVYDALTARNKRVKFETTDERQERIEFSDADFTTYSKSLSRMILAPAVSVLGNKRLLVVADGALQYIPFSTLLSNGKYLIESNEIVSLPSASVLSVLRKELNGRPNPTKTLAVLADPIFDKDDERFAVITNKNKANPQFQTVAARNLTREINGFGTREGFELLRLPFTRREADLIGSLVPPNQRTKRLDFEANRQFVLSPELSDYRYIHFATHGFINTQTPELSGIVLSLFDENGAEQDGFLRVGDIYNLKLNAEMVVLSGCRTGLGKEIKGEGLVGLTRGFMYAGARRVAVSLWDVNDEATSELMGRFYREMLGAKKLSSASALQQSQISMIRGKKWSNPYYWAAFNLQGEPK